ncbi:electron transport complex subunit RsxA [Brenneria izbisi]|uniref:Ion-translocating oxidoreductase complex subunit A n=1 Tax=Brenneria izbisi TaxID=2939450 RepID=A0AA41XYQ7_9GAMM|nr:electron transport complex subunit RsxA [Brenneria izbisi]MCV9877454.1 electron transport complex subunit RsxA [Brenneria izbisi]MCV9880980.1 electron transport complex subunit RsxA [Brenneria izbisi]
MKEILLIMLANILVNNVVLARFLGLCSFMGVTHQVKAAIGISIATTVVITLGSALGWLVEYWILAPLDLVYLRLLSVILLIASLVQLIEMVIAKYSPPLYRSLGIFLPLITTNCAVLGVALLVLQDRLNFTHSVFFGFSASLGYSLVMIIFAGLRERQASALPPLLFKGTPLNFITASILALAFTGFAGLSS